MSQANRQIDAQLRHGKQLHGGGRLAEAGQVYQQVLMVAPRHQEAQHMMGVLLLQMGRPEEALGWIERAIASGRDAPEFQVHRAHALLALGRAEQAAGAARAALRLKRGHAEAHQVLGHALIDAGDHMGGLKAYQEAARIRPELPDLLNNLGTALHHADRLDEAARVLNRALAKEPGDPGILVNLSSVLRDLGRFADAEARLAAAARRAPSDPAVLYNQGLLSLLLGRFAAAWPGWEERFRAGAVPDRGLAAPRWRGERLDGRTLLIHAEQGLGDTIQFCRFPFPTDGKVIFEVPPRLARLLGGLRTSARLVKAGDALPAFDLTCPLMSLPAVMGTTEATLPATVPYLSAEPDRVAMWRTRIGAHGFRVGVAWQGNPHRREDHGRSIRLEHYLPLAAVPGVRLISLQKGDGADQLRAEMPVETLGDEFDTGPDGFVDTAAVMENLDLVISSDTAIAHLAGALGRTVWVALRAVPDWRWMLDRADSPWYPTMRLFRQTERGQTERGQTERGQTERDRWDPVFAAMRDALAAMVGGGA